MSKVVIFSFVLLLSGCDNFSISGHTYRQYENICSEFGGLDRAYFHLSDDDRVILDELVCKNGVTLKYDYVKDRFVSESGVKK